MNQFLQIKIEEYKHHVLIQSTAHESRRSIALSNVGNAMPQVPLNLVTGFATDLANILL